MLLTGPTGFVGPHLLAALLAAPQLAGRTIFCLARPPLARVRVPAGAAGRVVLVAADLAADDLGVCARDVAVLRAEGVAVIFHNGARVDHVRSYRQLKAPNVRAAGALLHLVQASDSPRRQPPAFCFVSSLSALAPGDGAEAVCATPADRVDRLGGYGRSTGPPNLGGRKNRRIRMGVEISAAERVWRPIVAVVVDSRFYIFLFEQYLRTLP